MLDLDDNKEIKIQEFYNMEYFELGEKGNVRIKIPKGMLSFLSLQPSDSLYPIFRRNNETGLLTIFLNTKQYKFNKNSVVRVCSNNTIEFKNSYILRLTNFNPFVITMVYYESLNNYCIKLQEIKRDKKYV